MRNLICFLRILSFSSSGVKDLAAENHRLLAWLILVAGAALWVSASFPYFGAYLAFLFSISLVFFSAFIYVPAAVIVCNFLAGDGLNLHFSRREYEQNFVSLGSLIGLLLLLASIPAAVNPLLGFAVVIIGYTAYVPFVLKEVNSLRWSAGAGSATTLLATLPLAVMGVHFLSLLPLFVIAAILIAGWHWLAGVIKDYRRRQKFESRLREDLINPNDADALYQLGWLALGRRRFDEATGYFRRAIGLQGGDVDYHHALARTCMEQALWRQAFDSLERVYEIDPNYSTGDVLRDIGQVYFRLAHLDEAEVFLRAFLSQRISDAEGKYWLACVLARKGDLAEARQWLQRLGSYCDTPPGMQRIEMRHWKRLGRDLHARLERGLFTKDLTAKNANNAKRTQKTEAET
ncbi:MAG TPA: tetratricopeptide repeat protein [Acidobacteriota bacterium]|jgi:tetratricopeptide (TPR) repeat protein